MFSVLVPDEQVKHTSFGCFMLLPSSVVWHPHALLMVPVPDWSRSHFLKIMSQSDHKQGWQLPLCHVWGAPATRPTSMSTKDLENWLTFLVLCPWHKLPVAADSTKPLGPRTDLHRNRLGPCVLIAPIITGVEWIHTRLVF